MGSGMEHPIGSKAAKTALTMKKLELEMDPNGDPSSIKVSDESWIPAMNDVKKGVKR